MSYTVQVNDNFHYMDESQRYTVGEYDDYDDAVDVCRAIVDQWLRAKYKSGMTADNLYQGYMLYGEDPFVTPLRPDHHFSAWSYAKERAAEICD